MFGCVCKPFCIIHAKMHQLLAIYSSQIEYLSSASKLYFISFTIDMVAIPDFSAGAMENWGLITYRETALLYDDRYSSASNKQRVATVISHELAHQVNQ